MPKKQSIPPEIQEKIHNLIDEFNRRHLEETTNLLNAFFPSKRRRGYAARFKGRYLYLDRLDRSEPLPIYRLTWNGKMDSWVLPSINTQARGTILKNGFSLVQNMWMVQ